MAISDTIQSMQTNISNAYAAISSKGGTFSGDKNLANLADAIGNIPGGGQTMLYTPVVTLNNTTLTIADTANGDFVTKYLIYKDNDTTPIGEVNRVVGSTTVTYDLLDTTITTNGDYQIKVAAHGNNMTDSNKSVPVRWVTDWYIKADSYVFVQMPDVSKSVYLDMEYFVTVDGTTHQYFTMYTQSQELNYSGAFPVYSPTYGGWINTLNDGDVNYSYNNTKCRTIAINSIQSVTKEGYSWFMNNIITNLATVTVTATEYEVAVYDGIESTETGTYNGVYLGDAVYDNPYVATISAKGIENGVIYGYVSVEPGSTIQSPNRIQAYPTISANLTLMADLSGTDPNTQYNTSYVYKVTGNGTMSVEALCLIEGTQITLVDGSTKAIEDITYDDELLVWDFYEGKLSTAKPKWIMQEGRANKYNLVKFSNGTSIGFAGPGKNIGYHRIFNQQAGAFTHTGVEETPNGTLTYDQHGYSPEVVSQEIIEGEVKYYNIITDKHFNLFANGILTSCRLSNKYKIEDMKYVGEELISVEDEENYFKRIEGNKK